MKKEITCRECGLSNPHGSKFCNNCGARLPISTHIMCPNCESANPRDRVFCDNCGTRLIRQSPVKEEEPKQDSPPAAKAFSLPARRPGQTGQLDPDRLLDWLRTGQTGQIGDSPEAEEDKDEDSVDDADLELAPDETAGEDLPKLEDLTPEKRVTDDLPDWLVDDSDSDPIIISPEKISTELYLDLLQQAEAEDSVLEEPPFDTADANLPDWLADAGSFAQGDAETSDETDLSAWFPPAEDAEAHDSLDFETINELDAPDSQADSSLPVDWLAEADQADDDLADWFSDLDELTADSEQEAPAEGEADFDALFAEEAPAESEADFEALFAEDLLAADEDDQPDDWLSELEPPETTVLSSDLSQSEPLTDDLAAGDLPDWIEEQEPPETTVLPERKSVDEDAAPEVDEITTGEFADFFQQESEEEALPDWLASVAAEGDTLFTDEETADDLLDELFSAEEIAVQSELDWLAQTGGLPQDALADEAAGSPDDAADIVDDLLADDKDTGELDWLTELAAMDTDLLKTTDEDVIEPDLSDQPADEALADDATPVEEDLSDYRPAQEPPVSEAEKDTDAWLTDSFIKGDSVIEEDIPEWLRQLGPAADQSTADQQQEQESELEPSQGLPEWLAQMKPGSDQLGSSLPGISLAAEDSSSDMLADIPEELAGADLPDWLQDSAVDAPVTADRLASTDDMSEMAWLELDRAPEDADFLPLDAEKPGKDWGALLDALPPSLPTIQLAPADLPEWVQELKPGKLRDDVQRASLVEDAPEQTSGPLAGLRGVIEIEPVITLPRSGGTLPAFTVTPEQQQQVELLAQLARQRQQPATAAAVPSSQAMAAWVRLVLVVALLAAVLVGLLWPNLLSGQPTPAFADGLAGMQTAVDAAAGQPVLVAFEYTPALAGELTPQAETILAHLVANNSPIITVSQYAAGTAVAQGVQADAPGFSLGYLPGEAIGLRQLGDCLARLSESCATLPVGAQIQGVDAWLRNVKLVIVFTGERTSLVNWMEQVGSKTDIPLVLGVTESLGPVAAPYLASGQAQGMVVGVAGTAAYRQTVESGLSDAQIQQKWSAQAMAQLLVAAVLLIGLVSYGIVKPDAREAKQK